MAELRALTGLSLSTIDEWQKWWQVNDRSYVWPSEQEERWATAICAEFERSNERNVDRVACIADITSIPRKMVIEITLLAALLFAIWPLGPALVRACRQIIGHRRPVRGTVFGACLVAALFYVVAVFPYAWFHYAPGASTTYAGPGYMIFSGPYPFHLQYKPGNTIIYRQFVELLFDPTIRMVNAGWLTWMPAVPVYVVALVPYLVAAAVVGCGTALLGRRRRMSAPAAVVLSGLPEYYDVDPQRI